MMSYFGVGVGIGLPMLAGRSRAAGAAGDAFPRWNVGTMTRRADPPVLRNGYWLL